MLSVAIPVAIYVFTLYALYSVLMRAARPVPPRPARGHRAVLLLAVVLATAGASMTVCLLVLMLAPVVTVVGYETLGHRHVAAALERL